MIDLTAAEQELKNWITEHLSVPREQLNNLSACPYAKSAVEQNKIKFEIGTVVSDDLIRIVSSWHDEVDGVVLIYDRSINSQDFVADVINCNREILMPNGLVALEDHPDIIEHIAGLTFNQGTYAIIIVQRLDKLNKASANLSAKGYYKNWDQSDLDDVVSWRLKC